ncbi:YopX family protein [Lactococcus lactis]|uniref:YopX family protein n=1 Tax=Lactococcus lactis TaxID=1358 RepID=UPI00289090D3|nr:YopX family protein [Lactococcus lactis]MDT2857922.1 YopX family protein [Lactococcus lactis]
MIPKLRAWDKVGKSISSVSEITYSGDLSYLSFVKLSGNNRLYGRESRLADDVILMQSTGLKDKNGVEIYEGDILKLHAIFLAPDDKIGYIEYSPKYGYSIIFEGNRLYRQEYWASTNKLNYEVIGNIYENPELLREDTKND